MVSEPVGGVSAEAFVAVVTAYADRVHDDVRRLGATPAEAVEIVEGTALDVIEALRVRPDSVTDLLGEWFRRARQLAERVAAARPADPAELDAGPVGPQPLVVAGEEDARVRTALAQLAEGGRNALLFRDSYDLPYRATAVALGTSFEAAPALVAQARLAFARAVGGPEPPKVSGHDGPLGALAQYVDHQLPAERTRTVQLHVQQCGACRAAEPAMRESRRLLSSLAVIALSDADRDEVLGRVREVAYRLLPLGAALAAARERAESAAGRRLSVGLVLSILAAALIGGGLVGAASTDLGSPFTGGGADEDPTVAPTATVTTSGTPTASVTPTVTPTPTDTPTTAPTSASPTVGPTETPTTSPPTGAADIRLNRSSGRNCTAVRVTGSGWLADRTVAIRYESQLSGDTGTAANVTPNGTGRFAVTIRACGDAVGRHNFRATNGVQSDSAPFTATGL